MLVLEAGRPDYRWDVFIHMPAALAFPIGSRFYDWKYESEPEPHMGGRRIYHARGKVLGGSSSINGMIFQRGNPMDYERWAADPGMETWDYAHCLPYFKRMETCLAGPTSSVAATDRWSWNGDRATNPLFDAFFEAVQQAGYPLTKTSTAIQQEGFAALRPQRASRSPAQRGLAAYLHPVMKPTQPRRHDPGPGRPHPLRGHPGDRCRVHRAGRTPAGRSRRRGDPVRWGVQLAPTAAALRRRATRPSWSARESTSVHDLPGVGENLQDHLEVYIQHAATQPVSIQPWMAMWRRPLVGLMWLFRKGPGATNHFEAGGFVRSNDDVAYPNLMFHFLPIAIRYDGTSPAGRPRLSGPRRPDVLRRPWAR